MDGNTKCTEWAILLVLNLKFFPIQIRPNEIVTVILSLIYSFIHLVIMVQPSSTLPPSSPSLSSPPLATIILECTYLHIFAKFMRCIANWKTKAKAKAHDTEKKIWKWCRKIHLFESRCRVECDSSRSVCLLDMRRDALQQMAIRCSRAETAHVMRRHIRRDVPRPSNTID